MSATAAANHSRSSASNAGLTRALGSLIHVAGCQDLSARQHRRELDRGQSGAEVDHGRIRSSCSRSGLPRMRCTSSRWTTRRTRPRAAWRVVRHPSRRTTAWISRPRSIIRAPLAREPSEPLRFGASRSRASSHTSVPPYRAARPREQLVVIRHRVATEHRCKTAASQAAARDANRDGGQPAANRRRLAQAAKSAHRRDEYLLQRQPRLPNARGTRDRDRPRWARAMRAPRQVRAARRAEGAGVAPT